MIIDASAVVELLLGGTRGRDVADSIAVETNLAAPEVIDLEVIHSFRRLVRSGLVDTERAGQALSDFFAVPIERYRHSALSGRIWELRDAFSAYDAAYVVLAEGLEVPLVTGDRRLARGVETSPADVEVVNL